MPMSSHGDEKLKNEAQCFSSQQAALCRFAGAVEKLTKLSPHIISNTAALHKIRDEVRRLNEEMGWKELS